MHGSNPFQKMSAMPPPAPVTPVAPPMQYQQNAGYGAQQQGLPQQGVHQQNLMDEIGASIKATNSETIIRVMRGLNLVLASATITAGVLAWVLGQVTSFQKVIAGIYVVLFGVLLLAFELRTDKLDVIFRANFGFMYGNLTRTIFLLFIAIWPLSLGNFWVTILDALLLFLNAFFNYYVISQHPAFSQVLDSHGMTPGQPGYAQQQPVV